MKKTLILLSFLFIGFSISAQTLNGVPLSELDSKYIKVFENSSIFNTVTVRIETGQRANRRKDMILKDKNGKDQTFNSMMDVLNLLDQYNYELVQVYVESDCPSYIMKKI